MLSNIKCPACNRRRKPAHERLCGTKEAYSPDCLNYNDWSNKNTDRKAKRKKEKAKIREEKAAIDRATLEKWIKAKEDKDAIIEAAKVEAERIRKEKDGK